MLIEILQLFYEELTGVSLFDSVELSTSTEVSDTLVEESYLVSLYNNNNKFV